MARTVKDANIGSRSSRLTLKVSGKPYYRQIDPGLHLGYRKGKTGGKWVVRWYVGEQQYRLLTMNGIADDRGEPDGISVISFAQAQERARKIVNGERAGALPSPLTIKNVCENYVEFLRAERKTADDTEGRLEKHVYPALGDMAVIGLTTTVVEKWKRGMVRRDKDDPDAERRSKDSANRVLTMIKAALNRAFQDESNNIPTDVAWRRVKPFEDVGRARQVHLDVGQSTRLINACQGAFKWLVTGALLTGARPPHELATPRVRDFRADLGTLSVDGKTGQRDIVLTKEAVRYFREITAGRGADKLLFPKDDGTAWAKNHHQRPMQEAVKRAKLPADTTIYSLRHTYASQSILAGMNLKLLAENMGTSIRMLEVHYGKFIAGTKRKLVEESAFKIGLKRQSKVVSISESR